MAHRSLTRNRIAPLVLAGALGTFAACGGRIAPPISVDASADGGPVAPAVTPPTVLRQRWSPYVIPETQAEPVLFEAQVSGKTTAATLTIDGKPYPLRDDGAGGDRTADDGIWTVQLPAATVLAQNKPEWVNRPYVGALRVAGADATYNVFAEVWTAAIGNAQLYPVDLGQETDYVVSYLARSDQLASLDPAFWARRFYTTHPDQFDFLNIVLVDGVRDNRHHGMVRNAVSGIGAQRMDVGATFGSAARLMGYNVFPLSAFFDHGGVGFLHETGHQWINYLPNAPLAGGTPHWPKGSVAINVMGFSIPPSAQGGQYLYSFAPDSNGGYVVGEPNPGDLTTFNMLELYLMGLASAAEVPEYFALKDQNLEIRAGQALAAADITPIRVADIIAAAGPRVPDAASAQKQFRSATIVLSERPLDAYAMSLYDHFARRGEAKTELDCSAGLVAGMRCKPWFLATRGRSTMATRIR
ncbi:hypothetical protein NX773_21775 [Massilia solisilvae]|uniref:Lipoprotein n=1 Tax=Massilia solisilvae TaxID=1811225 RepID=A0ABT2BQN3_9BURK|nr:choice-of-anchor X domain-containing protein [Massilia solisilvae]MCS0610804.1 hypothetical protein [Massilia solisilvae]